MNDITPSEPRKNAVPWEDISKPSDLPLRVQQKMVELSTQRIGQEAEIDPRMIEEALRSAREICPETEANGSNILTIHALLEQLGGKLEITAVLGERRIPLKHTF